MAHTRPLWLASLALTLVPIVAPAQEQPALAETVEVRLLEIEVVVSDSEGKPVLGLTQADFELLENGTPQNVTNLSEYRDTATPATAPELASPAAAVSRPSPRTLVVLLDAIQLRGRPRLELFDDLRALVDRTIRSGDRAQILAWTGGAFRPALDLTFDRAAILNAITEIEKSPRIAPSTGITMESYEKMLRTRAEVGSGSVRGQTISSAPYDPVLLQEQKRAAASSELATMQTKTVSMQRIVSSFANPTGRTIAVYVSEQFPRVAGKRAFVGPRGTGGAPSFDEPGFDTRRLIASVVATANANGVAFYALYPRIPSTIGGEFRTGDDEQMLFERLNTEGPGTTGSEAITDQLILQNDVDALQQLAGETGGTVGVGAAGVKRAVDRIASDLGSYYSLGWRAQSDGTDRERQITVRTKNRRHVVRARRTIVEKSERTRAEDLLVAQLIERGSAGDLELGVDVRAPKRTRRQRTSVPVELTIPVDQLAFVEEGGERTARFTVLSVAGANAGETTKVMRETRRLPAGGKDTAAGIIRYTLDVVTDLKSGVISVGVFDETSGKVGIRTIELTDGTATVTAPPPSAIANAAWRDAFARSVSQRKPLVVFFRPSRCKRCDDLETSSLAHPAIRQRAPGVAFAVVSWPSSGRPPSIWPSSQPGVGLFDPEGALRLQWGGVPDTMQLGRIFDGAVASSANLQRAAALAKSGGPHAAAVEHAIALLKLGFNAEARAVLEETAKNGDPQQQQRAMTALAPLDAREGRAAEAMATLTRLRAAPVSPEIAAEASFNFGVLSRHHGAEQDAQEAFRAAVSLGGATSPVGRAAAAELALVSGAIRLVPFDSEVISGTHGVRTVVSSPAVARVVFTLDGNEIATVTRPPFSTAVNLGRLPEPHRVRVVGYDASGTEIGRDEMAINKAGNVFWVRLTSPPTGKAVGEVVVTAELRAPAAHRVTGIALTWNDEPLSTIATEPWRAVVPIRSEIGVLRATATLDDGRTAEDAVLLNGTGHGERMDVQLMQLPVTVMPRSAFAPADVVVMEAGTRRVVESVVSGSEAPLTVGIVIDTSSSMQMHLDEVQQAALHFLESSLGASDQAFLISFDSSARLVVATTSDRNRFRDGLLKLLPNGYTALHDAIMLGLLQMEGVAGRRALLVFTDGDDTSSRYAADDVAELSRRSNVPIYLIAPKLEGSSRGVVRAARASGGHVHEVTDVSKILAIYVSIAEALRAQTLVTIRTPSAVELNEWREISVEIPGRKLEIRAPAGYYAPR